MVLAVFFWPSTICCWPMSPPTTWMPTGLTRCSTGSVRLWPQATARWVVVTHDEAYARQADEVYVLEEGRLARREEVASC